jgi:hypothetical protein
VSPVAKENGRLTELAYPHPEEVVLEQVKDAIRAIEYGSVLIKIHQGEVVGIETSTKVRLRNPKS